MKLHTYSASAIMCLTRSLTDVCRQVFMCIWFQFNGTKNNQSSYRAEWGTQKDNRELLCDHFSSKENAVNGDHLWMETSCSGELCYLGEDTCLLKTAVSTEHYTSTSALCLRAKGPRLQQHVLLFRLPFSTTLSIISCNKMHLLLYALPPLFSLTVNCQMGAV